MKSNFADGSLVQLTLVRFREFLREPEALFWVFLFPILLAAGLGLAFRNRPAEVLKVGAVTPEITQSLRGEKLLDVQQLDPRAAEDALRAGKSRSSPSPASQAPCNSATTIPIPKAAPRACLPIAPFKKPLAASIP